MAVIVKCWRSDCENNYCGICYSADDIELDTTGQCMTYIEKDIYAEVEGFKRDEV